MDSAKSTYPVRCGPAFQFSIRPAGERKGIDIIIDKSDWEKKGKGNLRSRMRVVLPTPRGPWSMRG